MWRYTAWPVKYKWVVTGFFVLLVLVSSAINDRASENVPTTTIVPKSSNTKVEKGPSKTQAEGNSDLAEEYELLGRDNSSTVDNLYYLVPASMTSEDKATAIAQALATKECNKPCNVSLFDDRQAYELDREYAKLTNNPQTTPEDIQQWRSKNYVFLADHSIGYTSFDAPDVFWHYPLKDDLYNQLKK